MRSSSSRLKGSGSPAANKRVETLLYVVLGSSNYGKILL
jgi:hypothetical protein